MKKIIAALVAATLVLSLAACGAANPKPKMYIDTAALTTQETDIAELLGANTNQRIYDFVLDDSVKSMQVNAYKLVDGSWEMLFGGGGQQFTDAKGRLALDFDNLHYGLRVALQSKNSRESTGYKVDTAEDFTGMGVLTTGLESMTEIVYEQEIPLVLQIASPADTITSGVLDNYFSPEELTGKGYEHVYAITICFSQKPPAELAG